MRRRCSLTSAVDWHLLSVRKLHDSMFDMEKGETISMALIPRRSDETQAENDVATKYEIVSVFQDYLSRKTLLSSMPDQLCSNSEKLDYHDANSSIPNDKFYIQWDKEATVDLTDLVNGREKLKKTCGYKRAMEEEWASRQREIHIQPERKKKKVERMLSFEIERRQRQRLKEIREIQKKEMEDMNLKEQLRVEVKRELTELETTCKDMASVLRGLGVDIEGSSYPPSSHQVHAAYKGALLRFHPDRKSKTDVRQQVEAEEKFKLISCMKENFSKTSAN